jgi:transcriptional regulator with XRE-family HTH domain
MANVETFSARLKQAMKIKGMTASQVARTSGLSKVSLSRYINERRGNPTRQTIDELAACLEVNPSWLMGSDVPRIVETAMDEKSIHQEYLLQREKYDPYLHTIAEVYNRLDEVNRHVVDLFVRFLLQEQKRTTRKTRMTSSPNISEVSQSTASPVDDSVDLSNEPYSNDQSNLPARDLFNELREIQKGRTQQLESEAARNQASKKPTLAEHEDGLAIEEDVSVGVGAKQRR